jgi:RHH-type proline utilization regulon transcriptional repressor/proline dehydrogenase/delta 1-pyrroline-5-carboxylate dehydrogenase
LPRRWTTPAAWAQGFRYSYDMLGEAALTEDDAARYMQSYVDAIHAIGKASAGRGIYEGPGISIKLSALHPRYSRAQYARVMTELLPRVLQLAELARQYDIGMNIDAEEADRLELSLDLLEALCHPIAGGLERPGLCHSGLPEALPVRDRLCGRPGPPQRPPPDGAPGQGRLLGQRDQARPDRRPDRLPGLHPQGTHRCVLPGLRTQAAGRTGRHLPAVRHPQRPDPGQHLPDGRPASYQRGQYEFQCLHGMGEPLYEQVVGPLGRPCRIYAPVGTHETLLAYLVRRLLENGANSSFVHRIADPAVPARTGGCPVTVVDQSTIHEGSVGAHHAHSLPGQLYGPQRANSQGLDLSSDTVLPELQAAWSRHWAPAGMPSRCWPCLPTQRRRPLPVAVRNPADHSDPLGGARCHAGGSGAGTAGRPCRRRRLGTHAAAERARLLQARRRL